MFVVKQCKHMEKYLFLQLVYQERVLWWWWWWWRVFRFWHPAAASQFYTGSERVARLEMAVGSFEMSATAGVTGSSTAVMPAITSKELTATSGRGDHPQDPAAKLHSREPPHRNPPPPS